jgi:hydroxyacylglutathione hydrolase
MDLKIQSVKVGAERTNCYVVSLSDGTTAIVDPGAEAERILALLSGIKNLSLKYILLTHGHFDHVGAVDGIKKSFPDTPVMISEHDITLYQSVPEQGLFVAELLPQPKSELRAVQDGESLLFGNIEIEVMATPGHTPGGVCYRFGKTLFTGDTLFYHTVGRTDLPFSDDGQMETSLSKLSTLVDVVDIYPGHGRQTTLAEETKNNPYL